MAVEVHKTFLFKWTSICTHGPTRLKFMVGSLKWYNSVACAGLPLCLEDAVGILNLEAYLLRVVHIFSIYIFCI